MKRMTGLMLVLLMYVIFPAEKLSSQPRIRWYDFNSGITLAMKQKKPMVISFFSNSCHWCSVMDDETFSNSTVVQRMKKYYIAVKVNLDSSDSIILQGQRFSASEFATLLGIDGLPATIFMDKNGKFITNIPGFIKTNTFLPLLRYVRNECYKKKISFQDYLNGKDCN